INEEDCTLDMEHLSRLLSDKTRLVAVTYASNTTGSIVDVLQVVSMAHNVGAQVYVDAVHYAPHHLVDVQALGCDFLACSAYKFFGPHVGIAYIADQWLHSIRPYKVEPATNIGPGRFETGTQSFEGLAGVVSAVEYLAQFGEVGLPLRQRLEQSYQLYEQHEQRLSERFLQRLNALDGVNLFGIVKEDSQLRTPTFALTFD
ncbi:aminotransferase class V-fold PLP-dependent enzyme, partial [Vibrio parahaemolyticus]|nr:aminotransferase class V-fold PLP-dependent enzyme [Vibrio parahaemolyticus]